MTVSRVACERLVSAQLRRGLRAPRPVVQSHIHSVRVEWKSCLVYVVGSLDQCELLEIGEVLADQCFVDVWNIVRGSHLMGLYRVAEDIGGGDGAA